MTIQEILQTTSHRPWQMPKGKWKYYQEWNNAIFLHFEANIEELEKLVPKDLEIDTHEGKAYVSIVPFTMERIRQRNIPAFSPISNFHEVNIRTYVKYKGKDSLPNGMLEILERHMSADIAVYRRMANFNNERAELRKLYELAKKHKTLEAITL